MAYQIYIGGELMPVTPSKIKAKYKGNNTEVDLINGVHINRINEYKLPEWSMSLLIPAFKYPFVNEIGEAIGVSRNRDYYLNHFNDLAARKQGFNFMIIRTLPNGDFDFGNNTGSFISNNNGIIINTAVSLEDYTVTDDAGEGFDITIDVTLKKWVGYGTQKIKLDSNNNVVASSSSARVDTKQTAKSYTVKSGDTLYNICRAELGDGSKYKEIAELNGIANADKIYIGQVIRLG
jgi:hypothetical protein